MDPDANLKEQLEIARWLAQHDGLARPDESELCSEMYEYVEQAERLAELVQALDGWLANGGFLPERWRR